MSQPKRITSREYQIYKEEEQIATLPRTIYEKAARFAGGLLNIEPDEDTGKMLQKSISFSHLHVKPTDVASLTIFLAFAICFPTLIFLLLNMWFAIPGPGIGLALVIIVLSIPFSVFMYMYPVYQAAMFRINAGSDIVTMILYMAIYIRNTPNLEGATVFAAENLTGPLAYDVRKLLWDVETGTYTNVHDALTDYTDKWSNNKEFLEAVDILAGSLEQPEEKRINMLGEAINVILDGARENSKKYTRDLRMPVMIVNALGIILPVMGLVMFPIIAVFLGVGASVLFIGYDIVLPIALFFIIQQILKKRPATFSEINVEENPDLPPKGKFPIKIGNREIILPLLPLSVLIFVSLVLTGLAISNPIASAMVIIAALSLSPAVYFILSSVTRLDLRQRVRSIEEEFTEALFQLGNRVSSGVPLEMALSGVLKRIANLKIKNLFKMALDNMKRFGMTFGAAFFNEEQGAVKFYPSYLIRSTMKMIVESSKKGVSTASEAMLAVSRYLRGLHQTQEEVNEQMSETISTLKFQGFFLSPMITGVIGTLAIIIIDILVTITERITSLGGGMGAMGFFMSMGEIAITPFEFILVVGIYMVETSFILAIFINGIENGQDRIGFEYLAGLILISGFIVFALSMFISLSVFTPMIAGIII